MKCKTMERHLENNQAMEKLGHRIQGKVDFSFSRKDSLRLETCCLLNRCQPLPAIDAMAPYEVTQSVQNIGLDLGRLPSFRLGHRDRSLRGTTESLSDVPRIKTGDKVKYSTAILLNVLSISTFPSGPSPSRCVTKAAPKTPKC